MATRTINISDLSGEPEATTATVGLRGQWYEVDLIEFERAELESVLAPYIAAGRKAKKPKNSSVPETTVEEREQIRAWAKGQGYEVADFGRVPKKIYRAYVDAHTETAA